MDFELAGDLRMLKETVRKFVDRELIPIEMEAMDGPDLKPEIRAALEHKAKDLGLWLLDVPEEYGGMGLGHLGMVVVWEELARTVALPPRGPGVFGPEVRPVLFMLSPEQKEKAFRAGFTTKAVGEGTGLGLSIAKEIIEEKHGGSIAFESQQGLGTTFHVRIPVRQTRSPQS